MIVYLSLSFNLSLTHTSRLCGARSQHQPWLDVRACAAVQYNGRASNTESLIGGLHIAAVSSAWRSPVASSKARTRAAPLRRIRTLRHGCPIIPRPRGLLLLGAVKRETDERRKESCGDREWIWGKWPCRDLVHPGPPIPLPLPNNRRRITGESSPPRTGEELSTVHCFENIMKITSHHLMITGLAIRFNLRLIPLLLLFLGYTRGMPHVLRFGEKTYNLLQSQLATLIRFLKAYLLLVLRMQMWECAVNCYVLIIHFVSWFYEIICRVKKD